jgi:hypothetical protein
MLSDPCAAKRCVGIHPHGGCRYTDEAVKEPAVQRQLRIRRRHLGRDSIASITKYLNEQNPPAHRTCPAAQAVCGEIRLDHQERFGLAELQSLLPGRCG